LACIVADAFPSTVDGEVAKFLWKYFAFLQCAWGKRIVSDKINNTRAL